MKRFAVGRAAFFAFVSVVAVLPVSAMDVLDYYPLESGDSWTYSVSRFEPGVGDDSYSETHTVQPGTTSVGGVATKRRLITSGPGEGNVSYETSGALGLRLHRALVPDEPTPWGPRTLLVTYSPPAKLANGSLAMGEQVDSSGSYYLQVTGVATYNLTYAMTSRVGEHPEWVTVPAGRFETALLETTLEVQGTVAGQPFALAATERSWLAAGIGPVRMTYVSDAISSTAELTSTNLVYAPEPATALGGFAALSGLSLLNWLGRRRVDVRPRGAF